jgi:hypothetical protein
MNNHIEPGSLAQPSRFGLPAAHQPRLQPNYFADTVDDGITWQPDVYPHAGGLSLDLGRTVMIDIGCGRAGKARVPEGPCFQECSDFFQHVQRRTANAVWWQHHPEFKSAILRSCELAGRSPSARFPIHSLAGLAGDLV